MWPGYREPIGMVYLEAGAVGVPVVALASMGVPMVVRDGETGILAPGRWADVTILDVDPLALGETDPGAILDGKVVATIVAGEVAYRADVALGR